MASIKFDTTEILDTTHTPRFIKHESAPDRTIVATPLAREDGQVFIYERYDKKLIQMQGVLKGSSQADLESKIDTFKELFSRPEKNLDIDWNGGTRRYVATCSKHTFDRDYFNINMVPWTAEFTVLSGTGNDTSLTTDPGADGTSGTQKQSDPSSVPTYGVSNVTIGGSKRPKPLVTLSNLSLGSAVRGFEYKNKTNGQVLQVTADGSWGNSRTCVIDFANKTVVGDVISGVSHGLNIYGTFPTFDIGACEIDIQMGGIVNQKSADSVAADMATSQLLISSTNDRKAQSFQVPYTDATFQGASIFASKVGTPGTLRWEIQTDNNGAPSGTLVDATNSKGTFSSVPTTSDYIYGETSSFAPFTLQANTTYWLVIKADATLNGSNEYFLSLAGLGDGTGIGATYARGRCRFSTDGGTTYNDFTNKTDMSFRIHYGGRRATIIYYHLFQYLKAFL